MSISIIIPTLQSGATLSAVLNVLGSDHEVIVVDGGSDDDTLDIARQHGARVVVSEAGRGLQLATGAAVATGDWLLFVHADTCLEDGWKTAVTQFSETPGNAEDVAVFRFALDATELQARRLEAMVSWRTRRLGLPYGDQALLISRAYYLKLGGFAPIPLLEDVQFIRRVPRSHLTQLSLRAVTSAKRWQTDGWWIRSFKNLFCLSLYFLGVSPQRILRIYG